MKGKNMWHGKNYILNTPHWFSYAIAKKYPNESKIFSFKNVDAMLVEIKIKWWEKTDLQLAVWYPDSLSVKNTTFSKF